METAQDLKSPAFQRFWRASAVSALGTYVTLFALQALVVLVLHGTATDVGWLNAARWAPFLVFGLIVGALVDGRRRLPLLIGTDVTQGLLLLLIPLLWWLDALSLPVLLIIVLAYGTASVVNGAASMSFLPRLIKPEHLQPAHARIDGADAASSTAGPALAGLMVSVFSAPIAMLVDALTCFYSALTLRGIRHDEPPPPRTGVTVRGLVGQVVEGIKWCYRGSGLATIAVATHVWFVGNAIIGVVLAPYVLRTLDLSAFQFGLTGAAGGVGAVGGAVITTWVGRRLGTGRTIILCHVITTLGVVMVVLAGRFSHTAAVFVALLAGQCLYGLAMGMSNSHEMSYRQLVTPDELQARTNTTLRSLNRAVAMVVAPIAGVLADAAGIEPVLILAAIIFGLVACGLAATSFRNVTAPV